MAIKVTIDGRISTDGTLLAWMVTAASALAELDAGIDLATLSPEVVTWLRTSSLGKALTHARDLLEASRPGLAYLQEHDDGDPDQLVSDSLKIVGYPEEDLPEGCVLLTAGPFSITVELDTLRRALVPFLSG